MAGHEDAKRFRVEGVFFSEAYAGPPGAFLIPRSVLTVTSTELLLSRIRKRPKPNELSMEKTPFAPLERVSHITCDGDVGAYLEWTDHHDDDVHGARLLFGSTTERDHFIQLVG